jgi:hypothetical protein
MKCFWARRVRTDQRWDAGVEVGGRHPESNTREGRSLDVDQYSLGRACPYRGVELCTTINEEDIFPR